MIFSAHTNEKSYENVGEEYRMYLYSYLNLVRTNEFPIGILIDDLLLPKSYSVPPVEGADVILHRLCHLLPVMRNYTRRENIQSFPPPHDSQERPTWSQALSTQKNKFS